MLESGNGSYETVEATSAAVEVLIVKCGQSYFVYALNNGDARDGAPIKFSVDGEEHTSFGYSILQKAYSLVSLLIESTDGKYFV